MVIICYKKRDVYSSVRLDLETDGSAPSDVAGSGSSTAGRFNTARRAGGGASIDLEAEGSGTAGTGASGCVVAKVTRRAGPCG